MWPLKLFWIDLPPPGRIAVMPRPHPAAFPDLKAAGVDIVVSLLEPQEASRIGLADQSALSRAAGIEFLHLPVIDHGIPRAVEPVMEMSARIRQEMANGKGIAVHCYAGIGRSPLLIAATFIDRGMTTNDACDLISKARGIDVPEMPEQFQWLLDYEATRR